ncbi:M56 family metallopeptidase [Mucilaginibacter sp. HD30]
MPELFTFLIKVNIALVLFCVGYYLVLRKLTFYTLNRVYLITAIIFSSVYPFIDLSVFAQQHQQIIAPVQNVVIIWQEPAQNFVRQAAYWNWLAILFWAGAALFATRLIFQLASLYKIYRRSTAREINGQNVRVVKGDISPFSFWQSIYINPERLSTTDLQNILEHEQIHVNEWHTLDVLLTEISVILYWFNPGIWMMKRAVRENIEFITDRKILQKGVDSKAYQYSLLNITFNQPAPAITSNFNFSTLKKRIMMMNAKKSSNLNLTRYAFLMPVVMVCVFTFSLSKAEVVKTNPAFKAVAAAVENIKSVAFNADTTPVKKIVTKTTPAKKTGATGAATNTITITTTDNKIQTQGAAAEILNRIDNNSLTVRGGKLNDSIVIVVDGKIVDNNNISNINPNTIRTVNVIKDNATTYLNQISGLNAPANGKIKSVIAITTGGPNDAFNNRPGVSNEVVVRGYGINKNVDVTNNLTGNQTNTNNVQPVGVTGLTVTTPGSKANIRLRANTLTSALGDTTNRYLAAPLIIIDGEIATEKGFEQINQDDIKSITVLKDASATSLYGEKAKNGAIIITTKKK